jgi:hypothetical protein
MVLEASDLSVGAIVVGLWQSRTSWQKECWPGDREKERERERGARDKTYPSKAPPQ